MTLHLTILQNARKDEEKEVLFTATYTKVLMEKKPLMIIFVIHLHLRMLDYA